MPRSDGVPQGMLSAYWLYDEFGVDRAYKAIGESRLTPSALIVLPAPKAGTFAHPAAMMGEFR